MLSKLDLDPKCQGHSRNDLGNKKHAIQKHALVIGVTPTPTRTPTAVKQYVDPHPMGEST